MDKTVKDIFGWTLLGILFDVDDGLDFPEIAQLELLLLFFEVGIEESVAVGLLNFDQTFPVDGYFRLSDHKSDILEFFFEPLLVLKDLVLVDSYVLIELGELGLSSVAADLHQPVLALNRQLRRHHAIRDCSR